MFKKEVKTETLVHLHKMNKNISFVKDEVLKIPEQMTILYHTEFLYIP